MDQESSAILQKSKDVGVNYSLYDTLTMIDACNKGIVSSTNPKTIKYFKRILDIAMKTFQTKRLDSKNLL